MGEDQTYNRGEPHTINSKPSFDFETKYVTRQKNTKSYVESDLQCITQKKPNTKLITEQ